MPTSTGYTPLYRIDQGGDDVTAKFNDRTIMIKVESREGGGIGDTLDITLDDRDFAIDSPSTGEGAATLDVFMGFKETALYEMGNFQLTECNYLGMPKSMRLVGSSLGFTSGAKSPIIASYDGKTLGSILSSLAGAAGMSANVDANLASKVVPFLNQHASSMHLVQELERRYGGLAKFQDGVMSFTPRGTGTTASGATMGNMTFGPNDFGTWAIRETNRNAYAKTRASWFDKVKNELAWVHSATKGGPGATQPFMLKKAYASQDEAQSAADATQAASNRTIRTGTLTLAKGDPSIRGGTTFTITDMRTGVNGDYTIGVATHTFAKESGIATTLSFYDAQGGDSGATN